MKQPVEITVMGQKLQVRSDSGENYIVQVAGYVDKKIADVLRTTKSVASLNVAILAAMNIADEYMKYREGKEQKLKAAEKKIQDVIEVVDLQL